MVLETTYHNKKDEILINDLVGKSFTFWQILKLKGIGSKRMIVNTVSTNMKEYINKVADITYANIELRPKGILVLINKGLRNFTWVIPYYQLVIYKSDGFSIHAQGKFVSFKEDRLFKENKKFINKLLTLRIAFLNKLFELS
ncbi:hypothetical protein [Aureibaculum conchae]|uniref:hypothetical protein n=1 Tax=Aureibaculum sp. 2308TA14-22 TaxID=3108392 RepID=UPI003393ADC8